MAFYVLAVMQDGLRVLVQTSRFNIIFDVHNIRMPNKTNFKPGSPKIK